MVHRDMLSSLDRLKQRASAEGFELAIASSFRDFSRQTTIWQEKIDGKRAVYSSSGELLNVGEMTDEEALDAILRWSALPGVSRHHWGTDFDYFDSLAIDEGYRLQLIPQEYQENGPFAELTGWLQQQVKDGNAEGFFFPYLESAGGVAPEPWHLSHGPSAKAFEALWTFERFIELLDKGVWPLENAIRQRAEEIYQYFVKPTVRR